MHALDPARADGAAGTDQRTVGVDVAPVHLGIQAVGGDGPYLQHVEDGGAVSSDVQVGGKLDLDAALDFLLRDLKQLVQDVRQREGIVFEDVREGDEFRAGRSRRIHHALVLVVIGGDHAGEVAERAAVRDRDAVQVDRVVDAGLELIRLKIKRIHGLLRLRHHQLGCRSLQDIARVFRGETEHLVTVHDGLAQAQGDLGDAVLRRLIADRVEVDRTGHAREGREEIAPVLAAADLLQHDGHLLLGEHVRRGRDVASRRGEIHGGVNALDSLGQQAELLVLVLRVRDHISRIDPRKRLIVRVLQLRRRAHGQRLADVADEDAKRLRQLQRQGRSHELREDLGIRQVGIDDVFQTILTDETVEILRRDHERTRHEHAHVFPLVVEIVFLEDMVQERQAARLAAQGP